jgi:hypothetical protein
MSSGTFPWLSGFYLAVFAALLASFPARNSDLWMHLAAGRDLARGQYSFGPAASAESRADASWLYDLASYGLYSVLGGRGLVLCKVLVVVGLGLVLWRLSRAGSRGWVPTACTALALLAMSTRLLLQPATVSYLFLALALFATQKASEGRRQRAEGGMLPSALCLFGLGLLFVVWANVDSWFLLGLGTVALVEIGQILDERAGTGARQAALHRRALLLASLAAACLLNPSHVYAFLHPGMAWFGSSPGAPAARPVTSPFQEAYWAALGRSPAGLAYFPLLALGLLSFLGNLPRWHWQRFLPWLGLALLSAVQVRAVPFFAVVAGPVLAWNLEEIRRQKAEGRGQKEEGRTSWVLSFCLLPSAFCLLVCAWPGWLQAPPYEPRRWGVELPPSLERGAAAVRHWHEQGKLGPDQVGLHVSPDSAHAFAWFCPEEKRLRDGRPSAAVHGGPGARDLAPQLRGAGVTHVVVYDANRERLFAALDRFWGDPEQWPLLYLEGEVAIFGWRDPVRPNPQADPFRGWEVDLDRLAFRPAVDKKAPRKRPEREPEPREWWDAFWKPAPPGPLDRDEAMLHYLHAEALRRYAPYHHVALWEASQSAGLVTAAGGWMGPGALFDANLRLTLLRPPPPPPGAGPAALPPFSRLALTCYRLFSLGQDDMPPALLYLAIRAARRALAVDPDDAQAYLLLGECYVGLLHGTRERAWGQRFPRLVELRRAQASAALNQALVLKPDLAEAHRNLVGLYQEMGYRDLTLRHLEAYQKLSTQARGEPRDPAAPDAPAPPSRPYEQQGDRLALAVAEAENAYAEAAGKLRVLDRALLAMDKGLAGKARDLLLATDLAAFGAQGMALELELLLRTGRPKEVREWTEPEQQALLGPSAYRWLRTQALAASGDYALAEEECSELVATYRGQGPTGPRETLALLVAQAVLDQRTAYNTLPDLVWRTVRVVDFRSRLGGLAQHLGQEADATVLQGLLALEVGEVDEAEVAFRLALLYWRDEAVAATGGGLDFGGRVIAQDCLKWLSEIQNPK